MLEKLFLDEWEWWKWGIATIPFAIILIYSIVKLSRMESPEDVIERFTNKLANDNKRISRAIAEPDEIKRSAILGYVDAKGIISEISTGKPQVKK